MSIPPITTDTERLIDDPSTRNCSAIWYASSLGRVSRCQFRDSRDGPSRRQDERKHAEGVLGQLLEDRERKGDGLSRSSLSGADAVFA